MTLIVTTAPTDIDVANQTYLSGLAGELLTTLFNTHAPADEVIHHKFISECNRAIIFQEYDHILAVGPRPMEFLDLPHYLYTSYRGRSRIIGVPSHTIAVDLRRQKYDEAESDEDEISDENSQKETAPTRAVNFAYWIEEGIKKLYRPRQTVRLPTVHLKPSPSEVKAFLLRNKEIYVDIETRRNQTEFSPTVVDCIGIGGNTSDTVLVIPVYNYTNSLIYHPSHIIDIIHQLSCYRGKMVLHNAMFDLTVLGLFMGMRFPLNVHDTMLMHHRIAPEAEKSLGHLIGKYTDQPYHKHEICIPKNWAEEETLYKYNAKDVLGTKMVYQEMLKEIELDSGLMGGMRTSCEAIPTYLEMTARGMLVDDTKLLRAKLLTSEAVLRQERIINILAGQDINIGSSQQLTSFFHDQHGYKVVAKSEKTGNPKLGKKELQSLAVKTRNPLIPLIIEAKKLKKSHSMLTFISI